SQAPRTSAAEPMYDKRRNAIDRAYIGRLLKLEVHAHDPAAHGRGREHVGVVELQDTRRLRSGTEHVRVVTLELGRPERHVAPADGQRGGLGTEPARELPRQRVRGTDLLQPDVVA